MSDEELFQVLLAKITVEGMDCLTPSEIMHLGKHLWKYHLTAGVLQSYKDAVRASAYKRPTTVQELSAFFVETYKDMSKNFSDDELTLAVSEADKILEKLEN